MRSPHWKACAPPGPMCILSRLTLPALLLTSFVYAQAPVFDATFAPNPNIDVRAVYVQPDGKTLVGGGFTQIAGVNRSYFARLNQDGTLDAAFNPIVSAAVSAIEQQPDGKILIGGSFTSVIGVSRLRIARLNLDGTLDPSFDGNLFGNIIRDILVLPDGKIIIAGDFSSIHGFPRTGLARLNPDGRLDPSFVGDAADRITPSASPGVFTVARQLDGRLLIGGQFGTVNGLPRRGLARLSANGVLDTEFDPLNAVSTASIQKIIVQRDGRFVVAGSFSAIAGHARSHLVRFSAAGVLEEAFNPRPSSAVFAVAELPEGGLLIGGLFQQVGSVSRSYLARLEADGQLDPTFTIQATGPTVPTSPGVQEIAIGADRWIVFGGSFTNVGGAARAQLARLTRPEPHIMVQTLALFAEAGSNLTLSPAVVGAAGTYQWRKDGTPLMGATSPVLTLTNVNAGHLGMYELIATNAFGAVSSGPITVNLGVRPQIIVPPAAATVTVGQTATLAVVATGTPSPTYQWQRNGAAITGATSATFLTVPLGPSADRYSVEVANVLGTVTSTAVTLTVLPPPRLANVSVRARLAHAQALIVGFSVAGGPGSVMLRASGPALRNFGVTDAMTDPRIELYRESTKLLENDNWPSVLSPTFTALGAFSFESGSRDAALMESLSGSHSLVTTGTGSGVVLVEAYDVFRSQARLVNVSARNHVGTGEEILIAGFICSGEGSMRVLVRAVGPTLGGAPFGVPGVLQDPVLELYDSAGVKIAENDNYDAVTAVVFPSVGAFALAPGARDAALLATVSGGRSYTAQVKGVNGGTGIALVEIYEVR